MLNRKSIDAAARRAWLPDVQRWHRERVEAFAVQHGLDLAAALGALGLALGPEAAGELEEADEALLNEVCEIEQRVWKESTMRNPSEKQMERLREDIVALAAERCIDDEGHVEQGRLAEFKEKYGYGHTEAYAMAKAEWSGHGAQERRRHRRIEDRAEARGISYDASAIELAEQGELGERAIDLSERSQGGPFQRWLDRPEEERRQLLREEAQRQGYDVG